MSVFMVGRRAGTVTRQRRVPAGSKGHRLERLTLRRMVPDGRFWSHVAAASGRSISDAGICRPGSVTTLT